MSENDHPTYHVYSKIRLTDSYNLFFSNAYNNISIITNIVPSANKICSVPNEGALNENQYPLNNFKGPNTCQTKINNTLIDNRFVLLDSDVLSDLYTDNGVDVLIKMLPNYTQPSPSDPVNLYQVNYFGWNRNCYNDPIFAYTNDSTWHDPVDLNNYKGTIVGLSVMCCIHFAYVLGMVLVYKIIVKNMNLSQTFLLLIDGFNFLLVLIVFIMSIIIYSFTSEVVNPYKKLIDFKCGDIYTNKVMSMAFDGMIKVVKFILVLMILVIIEKALMITYFLYYFFKPKEIKEELKEEKQS